MIFGGEMCLIIMHIALQENQECDQFLCEVSKHISWTLPVCHWSEKETNKARKCLTTHLFSVPITVFGFVLMLHHRRKIRKLWKGRISISKEVMFSGEVAKVWMEVTSCLPLFTCEILTGWKIETLWFPLPLTKGKENSWSSANMTSDHQTGYQSLIKQNSLWMFCMRVV